MKLLHKETGLLKVGGNINLLLEYSKCHQLEIPADIVEPQPQAAPQAPPQAAPSVPPMLELRIGLEAEWEAMSPDQCYEEFVRLQRQIDDLTTAKSKLLRVIADKEKMSRGEKKMRVHQDASDSCNDVEVAVSGGKKRKLKKVMMTREESNSEEAYVSRKDRDVAASVGKKRKGKTATMKKTSKKTQQETDSQEAPDSLADDEIAFFTGKTYRSPRVTPAAVEETEKTMQPSQEFVLSVRQEPHGKEKNFWDDTVDIRSDSIRILSSNIGVIEEQCAAADAEDEPLVAPSQMSEVPHPIVDQDHDLAVCNASSPIADDHEDSAEASLPKKVDKDLETSKVDDSVCMEMLSHGKEKNFWDDTADIRSTSIRILSSDIGPHRATEKPPQNVKCTTSVIEDGFLEESLDLPVDGSTTSGQCQPDLSSGFPASSTTPSVLEAIAEPSLMMTGEPALEHARDIHSSASMEIKLDNNQVENSASTLDVEDVLDENIAPACSNNDFVPSEKKEPRIKNDMDVEIKKKTAVPISFEAPEKTCEYQLIKSSYAEEDLCSTPNRSRIFDLGIKNPRGNTSLTSDHNYDGNAGDAPARSSATGTYKRQKLSSECSDSQEVIVKAYPGSLSGAKSSDRSESKQQSLEGNDINRVEVQASISAEKIIPDCALSDLATKESKEAVGTMSARWETPTAFDPNKKLLVLDINGLLADIVQGTPEGHYIENWHVWRVVSNKAVFRRPFCSDFLCFCFEKFNVGVWSSRAKKNMDKIIPFIFRSYERKLIFCWNAVHCTKPGFNTLENSDKPLMLKELRKLWENPYNDLPWNKGVFNETNTLLLDDSPYKALRNPAHTAVFPSPYDFRNHKDSSLGPGGDLREYLEGLADAENVQEYVSKHPFGQNAITDSDVSWAFYSKIVGHEDSAKASLPKKVDKDLETSKADSIEEVAEMLKGDVEEVRKKVAAVMEDRTGNDIPSFSLGPDKHVGLGCVGVQSGVRKPSEHDSDSPLNDPDFTDCVFPIADLAESESAKKKRALGDDGENKGSSQGIDAASERHPSGLLVTPYTHLEARKRHLGGEEGVCQKNLEVDSPRDARANRGKMVAVAPEAEAAPPVWDPVAAGLDEMEIIGLEEMHKLQKFSRYRDGIVALTTKNGAVQIAKEAYLSLASKSDKEKDAIYQYATDINLMKKFEGEIFGLDGGHQLLRSDMRSLVPSEWLTTVVIDCYLKMVIVKKIKENKPTDRMIFPIDRAVKYLSPAHFNVESPDAMMGDPIFRSHIDDLTEYISTEFGDGFFCGAAYDLRYFIFPWYSNSHYAVYVVDTLSKGCFILDSLRVSGQKKALLVENARKLLRLVREFVSNSQPIKVDDSFEFRVIEGLPRQQDRNDCGVFACLFSEHYKSSWAQGDLDQAFFAKWKTKAYINNYVRKMCMDLIVREDNVLLPDIIERVIAWKSNPKGIPARSIRTSFTAHYSRRRTKNQEEPEMGGDPDVQLVEKSQAENPNPKTCATDLVITPEIVEDAIKCYMFLEEDSITLLVNYARDAKLCKEDEGEIIFQMVGGLFLSRFDFHSLQARLWISSNIVDAYARVSARGFYNQKSIIDRIVFPTHLLSDFLMDTYPSVDQLSEVDRVQIVVDTSMAITKSYPFAVDYLSTIPYWIFPFCDNEHYRLYVIDTCAKGCFILDSFAIVDDNIDRMLANGKKIQGLIADYLKEATRVDISNFKWSIIQGLPRQTDIFSCGLFACKFMSCYSHEWGTGNIPQQFLVMWKEICREILVNRDNVLLPQILHKARKWAS